MECFANIVLINVLVAGINGLCSLTFCFTVMLLNSLFVAALLQNNDLCTSLSSKESKRGVMIRLKINAHDGSQSILLAVGFFKKATCIAFEETV